MSLLDSRPEVAKLPSHAPEATGFTVRSDRSRFAPVLGATLSDFYEEDITPVYEVSYRLVSRVPSVIICFALSGGGMDAHMAFRAGCTRDDGSIEVNAKQIPDDSMCVSDLSKASVLYFAISSTDLSVKQIVDRGLERRDRLVSDDRRAA